MRLMSVYPRKVPLLVFIVFALAYVLPGLIGHDPWKADEAYTFGNIFDLLNTGDWVVPHLAGEPFLEKPPLYHFIGAITATLMKPLLPLHDGARLASGIFIAVTLLAIGWSARRSLGAGYGRVAVLMTLSSVGLLIHAHMMLTDLALMAGFSIAVAGLVACADRLAISGLLLGIGIGITFLAKGFIGPVAIGMTIVALPLAFTNWRTRVYVKQIVVASIAFAPWLLIWPIALYLRSPDLFSIWFWDNNLGRFFGFSVDQLGARHEPGFWWRTYPWFLFPFWLFIPFLFRRIGRAAWRQPAIQIGVMLSASIAAILGYSASARDLYALPLLAPMAILATAGMAYAPRAVDRSLGILGIALSVIALIVFWAGFLIFTHRDLVPNWPWPISYLPSEISVAKSGYYVFVGACLSVCAIALTLFCWQTKNRGLWSWSISLALCWGLATTLWLPWIDAMKSYRAMYLSMPLVQIRDRGCIASLKLRESERAMLEYFTEIVTERREVRPQSKCRTLLIQGFAQTPYPNLGGEWHLIWSGSRPRDNHERFDLFVREGAPKVATDRGSTAGAN